MSHSISPEWEEGFTWAFDVPPKGQKLHIVCKSKNTFGKVISVTFIALHSLQFGRPCDHVYIVYRCTWLMFTWHFLIFYILNSGTYIASWQFDLCAFLFQNTLGKVTIQIDKVVTEGVYSGLFSLNHDGNKDGSSRSLEIEIIWSNRISNEGMWRDIPRMRNTAIGQQIHPQSYAIENK